MPERCTTARWRSIAAGCSAWCRRSTCPTTANSTSRGISWRATGWWAARSPSAALTAPFGTDLLFAAEDVPGLIVHAEICEDIWVPVPPSSQAALAGATVLANLSASNITIGKAETRRLLCASQSARCVAAYLYAAAGAGESTTDLAWDGQASIFENGATLAETERFPSASQFAVADIDLDLLRHERMQMGSFDTNRRRHPATFRRIAFRLDPPAGDIGLERKVERFPFVPADPARLEQDCYEAYNIQVSGLAQRLRATGIKRVVIGVSGGLDSTHALIVCGRALDLLGLPRGNILAYTMPGFATSAHTKANAIRLMEALGVTWRELDIRPAARTHAERHRPSVRAGRAGLRPDVRERAGRVAHRLSVPPGEPPQRHRDRHRRSVGAGAGLVHLWRRRPDGALQRQCRGAEDADPASDPLGDQLAPVRRPTWGSRWTRSSPPRSRRSWCPTKEGETPQSTEATIGPYALQDFNLYYTLRYGCVPSKIAFLALHAWGDAASGDWPPGFPRRAARRLRPGDDPPLAGGVPAPLLRVQPVQAVGDAERAEGRARAGRCRRAATGARRPTAMPMPGSPNWSATCRATKTAAGTGGLLKPRRVYKGSARQEPHLTQSGRSSTLWTNGGGMNRRELSLCFTSPREAGLARRRTGCTREGRWRDGPCYAVLYWGMLPGIRRPVFRCRPCRRATRPR